MKYKITDGRGGYITKSSKMDNVSNAYIWSERVKAENVLNSLKHRYNNLSIEETLSSILTEKSDKPIQLDFNLSEYVDDSKEKTKLIEQRHGYLVYKLSELDKKEQDILHCAEFYKLNASQGYKLYKILHEVRQERREVKNEIESIRVLLDSKISYESMENVSSRIYSIYHDKTYTPRVVDELFDLLERGKEK